MDDLLRELAVATFGVKETSEPDFMQFAPPEVRAQLAALEPEYALDETDTFGLHFPLRYAYPTWRRYRDNGLLPAAGGYDDQLVAWLEDVSALDNRYHDHWQKAKALWEAEHAPKR